MEELLQLLDAEFDTEERWIRIVGVDWFADDLRLDLSIGFDDDRAAELWEISCGGVVEDSLCSGGAAFLSVSAESPLLKSLVEPQVQIMFSQNQTAPESLFGIVCSCCTDVMGSPEAISKFINGAPNMSGICSSRYGLLGQFPESLATRILDALREKPITANALPGRLPTRWNGSDHVAYQQLRVLEIGASYVIAEQFSACRA